MAGMKGVSQMLYDYAGGGFYCEDMATLAEAALTEYHRIDFSKGRHGLDNLVLDAYASATIEGAVTTIADVHKGLKSKPSDKGTKMCVNCVNAVRRYGNRKDYRAVVKDAWLTLVEGVCENQGVGMDEATGYRTGMVFIGNHVPASAERIGKSMDSLFAFLEETGVNPLLKAAVTHFYVGYVHPFRDGNGRFARFLASLVMYNEGLKNIWQVPLSNFIMNSQMKYYHAFASSVKARQNKAKDITPLVWYLLNSYGLAFQSQRYGGYSESEAKLYGWLSKHDGAELTAQKAAAYLGVSDSAARGLLKRMAERGSLDRFKRGRVVYYRKNVIYRG